MSKYVTGQIFINNSIILEKINNQRYLIKCSCGNEFVAQPSNTNGLCRKCALKKRSKDYQKHGDNYVGNVSRLYRIWIGMRSRCFNNKDTAYKNYGGRGIKICDEWNEYLNFKEWSLDNGYKDTLSIDRINNNGDYEPSNCKWSNSKQQANNKRSNKYYTYNGETLNIKEWSIKTGIKERTLKYRKSKGWSIKDMLETPTHNTKKENL